MKKDIIVKIGGDSQVYLNKKTLGISGENLQGNIVFEFIDAFVDGIGWLEITKSNGEKGYLHLNKVGETYVLPILSSLLKEEGKITMQLRITQDENINGIPVFKSNTYFLEVKEAINATETIPEEYPSWIDIANSKLNEIDNLDIDIENSVVTITKKDGTVKSENVKGDAYVITDEDMQEIETNVRNDIQPILDEAKENSETAISISKGANQSLSYGNYETMITAFNNLPSDIYRVGQNILIVTLNVPDLWISDIAEESLTYTYTSDYNFTNLLKQQGCVQIGYYKLSALETQKVDLANYVKKTDYATKTSAGVVKTDGTYGINCRSNGQAYIVQATRDLIDGRQDTYRPIVPNNLDYAVRSVRPIVNDELPNTLSVNTIYDLGIQSNLTLNLPTGVIGDFIQVDFLCDVATNLTITSTSGLSELDLIPEAGMIYSLFFDWGRIDETTYGWRISYAEYVRAEV